MIGYWGKFAEAQAELSVADQRIGNEVIKRMAETLDVSQRFFVPDAKNVLVNFRADLEPMLVLPYPRIALLSEELIETKRGVRHGWKISLALAPDQLANIPAFVGGQPPLFAIMSMFCEGRGEPWKFIPVTALIGRWSMDGFRTFLLGKPDVVRHVPISSFNSDLNAIANLCVMLGLKNVSTEPVAAPSGLVKKRALSEKQPLYSYRILVVNGEKWDRAEPQGTNEGYRSHLRRGHVRTLYDGRRVWVRSSYVHGRKDGFVDKDYEVRV